MPFRYKLDDQVVGLFHPHYLLDRVAALTIVHITRTWPTIDRSFYPGTLKQIGTISLTTNDRGWIKTHLGARVLNEKDGIESMFLTTAKGWFNAQSDFGRAQTAGLIRSLEWKPYKHQGDL